MFDLLRRYLERLGVFRTDDYNPQEFAADELVMEYDEIQDNNVVDDFVEAGVTNIEKITNDGLFHTYSAAKIDFDLGEYGTYPVELALPRFPDEESEIESFLNRLGFSVSELPILEEGNFTVPFVRVDGEWSIDWQNIEAQEA